VTSPPRTRRRRRRVVDECVRGTHGLGDRSGGGHDRGRVVEVEPDGDELRVAGSGTGCGPWSFEPHVGRAHRGDDRPTLGIEVGGRGQAEAARRAGDDHALPRSATTGSAAPDVRRRVHVRPARLAARPSGPDAGKYGPGWPTCS
jgi:hypothetical protein